MKKINDTRAEMTKATHREAIFWSLKSDIMSLKFRH
jgi:hypothetical protein